MRGPKITVVGAGSYFFGKPVIWNMLHSEILRGGELALVDTDPAVLDTMLSIARRAVAATGAPTKISGSTDRTAVMKDSDFVVLSFSFRNAHYRGVDTAIAAKHGVTMCSSDTIGPGGIFRALRELPEVLRVADDVRRLCPKAWVINFINPTSVLGIGLMRHAPDVRSFALCDGNHEPHNTSHFLQWVGVLPQDAKELPADVAAKTEIRIAGVNHCTFLTKFAYDGRDMLPKLREALAKEAAEEQPTAKAKPRFNKRYALELMDLYGAYPTAVSHTKEYVPFFQGYGVAPAQPAPIICFDAVNRAEEMAEAWKTTAAYGAGDLPISQFIAEGRGDHATDIIESMWGGLGKQFYINAANQGAVTNLPDDAFLELRRDVDMEGPRPLPFGKLPRGVLGLTQQVLDAHELTVEAAVSHDRTLLLRAMATDPIINNLGDAKLIMEELFEAEREHLPAAWYK